jgi:hypothetical protein
MTRAPIDNRSIIADQGVDLEVAFYQLASNVTVVPESLASVGAPTFPIPGALEWVRPNHLRGDQSPAEPVTPAAWPPGFFDQIYIDDPSFARPDQGQVPSVLSLD